MSDNSAAINDGLLSLVQDRIGGVVRISDDNRLLVIDGDSPKHEGQCSGEESEESHDVGNNKKVLGICFESVSLIRAFVAS